MANDCAENKLIRHREGTTQEGRYLKFLDPETVNLMGFGVKKWMTFAKEFANHINFFDGEQVDIPSGDWSDFHNVEKQVKEIIDTYDQGEITPHLGLFICFLKLLEKSKSRLNGITKRHLDFYYHDVLQLQKNEAQPDNVYALFELAKNASDQLIQETDLLDAGKDLNGDKLNYQPTEELVVNKAKVLALKNTYVDDHGWYMSDIANSEDGMGAEIENDNRSWLPFGDDNRKIANKGFTLAAPSLKLTQGPRNITLIIEFKSLDASFNKLDIKSFFTVQHTGEKEWITINDKVLNATVTGNVLSISISLDESDDGILPYDAEIHEGHYNSEQPLLRILFDQDVDQAYEFFKEIAGKQMTSASIETTSVYSKEIDVKNDQGVISLDNPFYPFGSLPKKNAKLKIGAQEWIGKRITDVSLSLKWKDLPDDLEKHYAQYLEEYIGIKLGLAISIVPEELVYMSTSAPSGTKMVTGKYGENRFTVNSSYVDQHRVTINSEVDMGLTVLNTAPSHNLFSGDEDYVFDDFISNAYTPKPTDDYLIQLALEEDFLHDVYPKIYTYLAIKEEILPNPPYVPFAESLSVTISTCEKLKSNRNEITLFHEMPFGIKEIKNNKKLKLVSDQEKGGQLFIGLDQVVKDENIQLLLQLEEGSENPDTIEEESCSAITWKYLSGNQWKALAPDYLLKDSTDNFLKAGLLKITVPKDYGNSTLFDEDYLWLRASNNCSFDAVAKIVHLHTQAVECTFLNNDNELSHLKDNLSAETISKLDKRLSTIKTVAQPYASFNGKPEESDLEFYRRISERLRHKDRAVTIWDYEHLILQEFSFLHKIKCLNHCTTSSFKAPGNVLLVAVPDIKNQNVYDVFKPKLSKAKLNAIEAYVNQLNTLHVEADVISPNYEEVEIELALKVMQGLDANFYKKQLKSDVAQFLAPWAFDKDQPIPFGNALYASEVIYFIENLSYVDYIKDFKMKHNNKHKTEIIPTDQKSILTSVQIENHKIEAITADLCLT